MEELFIMAEEEMKLLKQPYVGTEHFLLAYLKKNPSIMTISYNTFKNYLIEIIGSSYKTSDYILYTPILRSIRTNKDNAKEAVLEILSNTDSIAYNILLSKGVNIEKLYNEINTNG